MASFFHLRGYRILPKLHSTIPYRALISSSSSNSNQFKLLPRFEASFKFRTFVTNSSPPTTSSISSKTEESPKTDPIIASFDKKTEITPSNNKEKNKNEDSIDKRVYPIALSTFMMGTGVGVLIPVMPLFVHDLGLTTTDLGMIMSTMGLVRVLVNIPLASLCDIAGRRPLLTFGPIVTAISIAGTGLATSFWSLVTCRFFTGLGSSIQMTGGQLYLTDISTPRNRARTIAPFSMAWSAGAACGPFIGGYFATQFGLATPFFVVGGITLCVAGANSIFLPETNPLPTVKGSFRDILRQLRYSMKDAIGQWAILLRDRDIFSVSVLHTAFWAATSACQLTLLPLMAPQQFHISVTEIGFLFTLFAVLNVVLSPFAATLSDKFGRKIAIVPGAFITSVAICLLTQASTTFELYALLTLWGVGNVLMSGSTSAFVADNTDVKIRSQALAMIRTGGDVGLFTGAFTCGFLAESLGIPGAMICNAGVLALSALYFTLRTWKKKPVKTAKS